MPRPERKRVVLSWELAEIADALDAARIISDAIATNQLGLEQDRVRAPRALTAMLSITWARLRDVNRAVRGDLDPGTISAPHNDGNGIGRLDEPVLLAWSRPRTPR